MSAQMKLQVLLAVAATVSWAGFALAQMPLYGTPRPVSNLGGSAGSQLDTIYRQDVGTGYTIAGQNALALRSLQSTVPVAVGRISSPRLGLGVGGSAVGKPFANFDPGPTVSPYLNLFREDFDGNSDFNYSTLVRPMLQQQQINQSVQRQNLELNRRMQSMAAQSDFNPQGSTTQFPTGHQTVFMYYGHFYPAMNVRRR